MGAHLRARQDHRQRCRHYQPATVQRLRQIRRQAFLPGTAREIISYTDLS